MVNHQPTQPTNINEDLVLDPIHGLLEQNSGFVGHIDLREDVRFGARGYGVVSERSCSALPQQDSRHILLPPEKVRRSRVDLQTGAADSRKGLGIGSPAYNSISEQSRLFYYHRGRYNTAEPLHERAFLIREKMLGSENPGTAKSLSNRVMLYDKQGRYDAADHPFKRALSISEMMFGRWTSGLSNVPH